VLQDYLDNYYSGYDKGYCWLVCDLAGCCVGGGFLSTASAAKHGFGKVTGADKESDYKSDSVIEDVVQKFEGMQFGGVYDSISERSSLDAIAAILTNIEVKVPVSTVLPAKRDIKTFKDVFRSFPFFTCLTTCTPH
jgi:hypothetical protein